MYRSAPEEIVAVLRTAEARRRAFLSGRTLDAWRVLNGAADGGPPGLTIDRYGSWLVASARESVDEPAMLGWAQAAMVALPADGLVLKVLRRSVGASTSQVFSGALPRGPVRVREEDAVFLCELNQGVSTGLFLDQRETRFLLRRYAPGVEVLNLFAYTAAFSVHAALGGALRVTSVDVSKKALRRGRENMTASGLDPDRHRWFDDDVKKHLARQRKRPPGYGLVILDPPVFGRARGTSFSLEQDLEVLVDGSLAGVRAGGVLVLSTHASALSDDDLLRVAEASAKRRDRTVEILHRLGLPEWDHPVAAHHPSTTQRPGPASPSAGGESSGTIDRGFYLKTLVLRVG